ncbi:hypothetical protein BT69DRAFT_129609 [Atractiella rhizophila]|nr:hypothetical protein BT69DRAFT_129609 [Atractiella rhizophila]
MGSTSPPSSCQPSHSNERSQPDEGATICQMEGCHTEFTFFSRKHHCRRCGHIVCWRHSQGRMDLLPPLDATSTDSSPGASTVDITGMTGSQSSSVSSSPQSNDSAAIHSACMQSTLVRVCDDCFWATPTYPNLSLTASPMPSNYVLHPPPPSSSPPTSGIGADLGGYVIDDATAPSACLEIPKTHKRQKRRLENDLPPMGSPHFTWSSF